MRSTNQRPDGQGDLDRLREQIDEVDDRLVELMAERARLAGQAAGHKLASGMQLLDPAREAAVVRRVAGLARSAGLNAEIVRDIFWRLIGLSRDSGRAPVGLVIEPRAPRGAGSTSERLAS
jgi:chorismate mutase